MNLLDRDTLIENDAMPDWAIEIGLSRCFIYRGQSMRSILRTGDFLYIRPGFEDISSGDVIVFKNNDQQGMTVHRVVHTDGSSFITRGDNNFNSDPHPISAENIIGRVEMVGVPGYERAVKGGQIGLLLAKLRWFCLRQYRRLRRGFKKPYNFIKQATWIQKLVAKCYGGKITVVRFKTPYGLLFKVLYRGRVVAQWWPELHSYFCRKPFDIFIPRPEDDATRFWTSKRGSP